MKAKPRRPIPADFVEIAKGKSIESLTRIYVANRDTVKRWVRETGAVVLVYEGPTNTRAIPDDFAVNMVGKSIRTLAHEYGVHRRTVSKWIGQSGLKKAWGDKGRTIPDDFPAMARSMCKAHLARHYGVGMACLERWIKETGANPIKGGFVGSIHRMGRSHKVSINTVRNTSIYDDAADTLRRERFPVNRCNERGGFDHNGKLWRVGWSVLTGDELLARAAKYQRRAA